MIFCDLLVPLFSLLDLCMILYISVSSLNFSHRVCTFQRRDRWIKHKKQERDYVSFIPSSSEHSTISYKPYWPKADSHEEATSLFLPLLSTITTSSHPPPQNLITLGPHKHMHRTKSPCSPLVLPSLTKKRTPPASFPHRKCTDNSTPCVACTHYSYIYYNPSIYEYNPGYTRPIPLSCLSTSRR